MNEIRRVWMWWVAAVLLLGGFSASASASPIRVVVVPHYVEKGADMRDGEHRTRHYRRVIGKIQNQLVRHGFDVVDAIPSEYLQEERDAYLERPRSFSPLNASDVAEKYGAEVVYVVWLENDFSQDGGYWVVKSRLEGVGYDNAGRSLGLHLDRHQTSSALDRKDVLHQSEAWVADEVGRVLTAGGVGPVARATEPRGIRVTPAVSGTTGGGPIERRYHAERIEVRLEGLTDSTMLGVFGRVLNTVPGVEEALHLSTRLDPRKRQSSYSSWRVTLAGSDVFRLQENVLTRIKQVVAAGGSLWLDGVAYRYTPSEVAFLQGIRAGLVKTSALTFVVDHAQLENREFAGGNGFD